MPKQTEQIISKYPILIKLVWFLQQPYLMGAFTDTNTKLHRCSNISNIDAATESLIRS